MPKPVRPFPLISYYWEPSIGFQMKITKRERDTVAPDYYVKYLLTLSKGGKDFSTTFVSDPRAFGEPTVTQVFSALADDALTLRKYSTDEFVDKLYAQGVKPSAALRAYDSCKETNLWMQDELYLSGWEIEEISKTLTKHEDEVNTLVEKAASCPVRTLAAIPFRGKRKKPPYRASLSRRTGKPPSM